MKKRILTHLYFSICIIGLIILSSCDLALQEPFEFKEIDETQFTFGETTAWQWLEENPKGEFGYMIECIKTTGLEDEYNTTDQKRTFFLIKDRGFTGSQGVFTKEFGLRGENIPKIEEISGLPLDMKLKLKNILLYNILPEYVEQNSKKLLKIETPYTFNTLCTDDNNKTMEIHLTIDVWLRINFYGKNSKKLYQEIKLHNYIFSNGNAVAHIIEGHVRLEPFAPYQD